MQAFSIANPTFSEKLKQPLQKKKKKWYVDDGLCFEPFLSLIASRRMLQDIGPKQGYSNEISKKIVSVALFNSKKKLKHFFRNLEFKY